jgi:hypothetical protein
VSAAQGAPAAHNAPANENLAARLITIYERVQDGASDEALDALHELIKEATS